MNPSNRDKRQQSRITYRFFILFAILISAIPARQVFAGSAYQACYTIPGYPPPQLEVKKVLIVLIDQTMKLTAAMKNSVTELVADWGQKGERVKILRFSANIQGQYTELVFDKIGNTPPTQEFLFHLHRKDKHHFLECIEKRKNEFSEKMAIAISDTLKITDEKLPKTNLIHSLYDLAQQLISIDDTADKTLLIISDGLENSDLFSFHKRGVVKKINSRKSMAKIRKYKLIPNWNKTKIYFMGVGYISDGKFYVRPKIIKPLKTFWRTYFKEGNATLYSNSIGTPMLLTKSIL